MSRQRVKNVSYDDDDYDGYDSADPEEQEFLEQCTAEVLAQLLSGEPSVTATRDEVQEALWHYYNDVEKSVNYLRGGLDGCRWRMAERGQRRLRLTRVTVVQGRKRKRLRRSRALLLQ